MANTTPNPGSLTDDQKREFLQKVFVGLPPDKHPQQWDQAWQQAITPWDRSTHHPALQDTLRERTDLLGPALDPSGHRKTALVPGCGKGYDVVLLASFGYDAFGLDVSPTAVQQGEQVRAQQEAMYPVHDARVGRGSATVMRTDFFGDGKGEGEDEDVSARAPAPGKFDLIFDYTFLCALPPPMRPRWAERMSGLLAPGGRLICVEFPLGKAPAAPGPPHGLSELLYVELLRRPGKNVQYDDDQSVVAGQDNEVDEHALVRVERWQVKSAHAGQENSCVSIWRHK